MKAPIDLVLSGSGTLWPCLVGAVARLQEKYEIKRIAGASGGGLVSAFFAAGWDCERMLDLSAKVLRGNMLDRSWWPLHRIGLHSGNRIKRLLGRELPGRMSDLQIPWGAVAVDLWTRAPVFFSSADYPSVPIDDVLRATMSIPFWFKAVPIRGMGDRLYVDGGIANNMPMGVWDDIPSRPTIGVRFRSSVGLVRPATTAAKQAKAVLSAVLDAANHTHVSAKDWASVIEIKTRGDGMDFELSSDEIDRLSKDGWRSVDKALANGGNFPA